MANFKRKKPRTKVRCELCADNRFGNSKTSIKAKYRYILKEQCV